ncbi:MAG: hypothetical protein NVS1B4_11120 [Gemmatimonadaceae bacterium]
MHTRAGGPRLTCARMSFRATLLTIAPAVALAAWCAGAQNAAVSHESTQAGDEAWNSGRRADARVAYTAVVRRDTTAVPRAVFRLATLTAWDGQYQEALVLYAAYARLVPTDPDVRIGVARTLAWAGRYDDADRAYANLSGIDPAESVKGRARIASWRGDVSRSEALWREASERFPGDAEAWIGLARILAETGRPVQADAALQRALVANPADVAAADLLRRLAPELRTTVAPSATWGGDSDGNQTTTFSVAVSLAPTESGRLRALANHREARLRGAVGTSTGGRLALHLSPLHTSDLHLDVGVRRLEARTQGGVRSAQALVTGGVHLVVRPLRRVAIGGGVSRDAFDETASTIAAGIVTTATNLDIEAGFPGRLSIALGAEHATLQGATPNTRWSANGTLQWRVQSGTTLGIGSRVFGYRLATTGEYFAPRQFTLVEGAVHRRWGTIRGWFAETDAGIGSQIVDAGTGGAARRAARVALSLGYLPAPGREVVARWGYANAAGGAAVADAARYEGQLLTLRALLVTW